MIQQEEDANSDVVALTDDTFDDYLSSHPVALVESDPSWTGLAVHQYFAVSFVLDEIRAFEIEHLTDTCSSLPSDESSHHQREVSYSG